MQRLLAYGAAKQACMLPATGRSRQKGAANATQGDQARLPTAPSTTEPQTPAWLTVHLHQREVDIQEDLQRRVLRSSVAGLHRCTVAGWQQAAARLHGHHQGGGPDQGQQATGFMAPGKECVTSTRQHPPAPAHLEGPPDEGLHVRAQLQRQRGQQRGQALAGRLRTRGDAHCTHLVPARGGRGWGWG